MSVPPQRAAASFSARSIAANYAGGTLGEVTSKHLGVLELGGASLQARSIFTLVPI